MESQEAVWKDPQCAFRVAWLPQKLDEIRILVVDALYAVPRGGIEIGAILLGNFDGQRLLVEDFAPIDCEHLTGPSFALSGRDETALATQLATLDSRVVGWLHSHTRSELAFSPLDAVVHNKYFQKPWQIAMLVRPAHLQPVRANYYFQDSKGQLVGGNQEFTLDPLRAGEATKMPISQLPPTELAPPRPERGPRKAHAVVGPPESKEISNLAVADREAVVAPVTPPPPAPKRPEVPLPAPTPGAQTVAQDRQMFQDYFQPPRPRNYLWPSLAFLVASLAGAAFFTRNLWLPNTPEPLRLRASDVDGKLIIRWNPTRSASSGELQITDGGKQTSTSLDAAQLARGLFVYSRQSPSETVKMKVDKQEETTSFAGPLPAPGEADVAAEKARAEAEQHAAKAKADLAKESARGRKTGRRVRGRAKKAATKANRL